MKKQTQHLWKIATIPAICMGLVLTGVSLTSCSADNKIVFANFSGYMNPEVQDSLENQYNVQWDEYESNETIPTFMKNGTYDLAIATQYKTVELARASYQKLINHDNRYDAIIQPIDWNRFDLVDENNQPLVTQEENKLFNFSKLKAYFTEQTWGMLTAYDLDGDYDHFDPDCKDNLLNWTIPYFAQTLSFGYRGEEIPAFHQPDVSFKTIFDYYQDTTNPGVTEAKLQLVKDERTDYDLARFLEDKSIFIENDKNISTIENLTQQFAPLDEAIKKLPNGISLEGDSNNILNGLALGDYTGAITYNGDLIYASNGGDYDAKLEREDRMPDVQNFHVVTPKDTLVCFDGIIFSNKIKTSNLESAYGLVKDISFITKQSGSHSQLINSPQVINDCFPLVDENDNPNSQLMNINALPLENFDYVYYNPVWSCMYDAIRSEDNNLVDNWQIPFFANTKVLPANPSDTSHIKKDGYYKNIEYPTDQVVSSNLNIANYAFINNSVKR